jgi:cell division transport system permease protein
MAIFKSRTSNTAKKGKPSYFMSILGVTIVLFIWGLLGILGIYLNQLRKQITENVTVFVYLNELAQQREIDSLQSFIKAQAYTKTVKFKSKEDAQKEMIGEKDETIDFSLIDSINPLPNTIEFSVKEAYVQPEKIKAIKDNLTANNPYVNEIKYSKDIVEKVSEPFKKIRYFLLGFALLMSILVFLLIDNTIKLAMYSNRFLIKTMQMVGATRNFITIPMDKRAVLNGLLSAGIAIFCLFILTKIINANFPPEALPHIGLKHMSWLFILLIIVGILITLISTHRSVIKYLKMRLDDLY